VPTGPAAGAPGPGADAGEAGSPALAPVPMQRVGLRLAAAERGDGASADDSTGAEPPGSDTEPPEPPAPPTAPRPSLKRIK
jgi:hypothetical protein